MENKQIKCVKGKSCLHFGSNYCRFVDELEKLKQALTEIKEIAKEKSNVNDWLALEILQKIRECEVENS